MCVYIHAVAYVWRSENNFPDLVCFFHFVELGSVVISAMLCTLDYLTLQLLGNAPCHSLQECLVYRCMSPHLLVRLHGFWRWN